MIPREGNLVICIKITNAYALWPSYFTSGNVSWSYTRPHAKWYKWISNAALLVIAKVWKPPKFSINKRFIFHLTCFYSFPVENKNEPLSLSPGQSWPAPPTPFLLPQDHSPMLPNNWSPPNREMTAGCQLHTGMHRRGDNAKRLCTLLTSKSELLLAGITSKRGKRNSAWPFFP